jgi:hypothetical protein
MDLKNARDNSCATIVRPSRSVRRDFVFIDLFPENDARFESRKH